MPVLLVARLVTGLGVGMLTPTATAHLHELHSANRPDASSQRFEIVSTAANIGGLGFGPLVAGILAQYLDAPLRLPYLVFGVLLLISIGAVALTPETVQTKTATPAYRPQRLNAGQGDPAGYVGRRRRRLRILRRLRLVHLAGPRVRRRHPAPPVPRTSRADRVRRVRRLRGGADAHQPA